MTVNVAELSIGRPPDIRKGIYKNDEQKWRQDTSKWMNRLFEELESFAEQTELPSSTSFTVTNGNTRLSFDTTTVTLPELAEVVGSVIDLLKEQGVSS